MKTREYLDLIATENARLSRLIENFLTFSRLERGRQPVRVRARASDGSSTAALDAIRDRLPAAATRISISSRTSAGRSPMREALVTALSTCSTTR